MPFLGTQPPRNTTYIHTYTFGKFLRMDIKDSRGSKQSAIVDGLREWGECGCVQVTITLNTSDLYLVSQSNLCCMDGTERENQPTDLGTCNLEMYRNFLSLTGRL